MTTAVPKVKTIDSASCLQCRFHSTHMRQGRCKPGDVCVLIESGRQIDRFFRCNPEYANEYVADGFWERRAIAARYVSQALLLNMMDDPDEVVRRAVAYRLPLEHLQKMIRDPDREVRITVADRLPLEQLEIMASDPDYGVRLYVARRLPPGRLFRMITDADRNVRKIVAERLPPVSLGLMASDTEADVRR